jgi:SAM-dependent methyltransferase
MVLMTSNAGSLVDGGQLAPRRQSELAKYVEAYRATDYRMGSGRMDSAMRDIADFEGSLLDVGCGRGELLDIAEGFGLESKGVEVVPDLIDGERVMYGEAYALPFPDKSFDHVTMFDVMEHLLPEDAERTVRELARVARQTVTIAISNVSDVRHGVELHINRRPYEDWDRDLRRWVRGEWEWRAGRNHVSETWALRLR